MSGYLIYGLKRPEKRLASFVRTYVSVRIFSFREFRRLYLENDSINLAHTEKKVY